VIRQRHTLPMMFLAACALTGCTTVTSTTRPASWSDQAKADPFHYDPTQSEWPSVSGGGIRNFDKNAFNRDLNNVLNP
jgi:hypothetical protein